MTVYDPAKRKETFAEIVGRYLGKKIVLICARYQYWGTVAEVHEQCLIMSNPTAVENSGPATGAAPSVTDPIPESIVIKFDAIELIYRPSWVENKSAHENPDWGKKKK